MNRFFDNLAATLVLFLLSLAVVTYFASSLVVGLIVAGAISLIFSLSLEKVRRKEKSEKCSPDALHQYFIKNGSENVVPLIIKLFPAHMNPREEGTMIYLDRKKSASRSAELEMVFVNYKFGTTSCEDIARFGRIAKKANAKTVYVLSMNVARDALAFGEGYEFIDFIFVTHKNLYKLMKKRGLLPEIEKTRPIRRKGVLRDIGRIALARQNFKRFLFIGAVLTLSSLVVPFRWMRIYYVVMAGITLILAGICLFGLGENIRDKKYGVFNNEELGKSALDNEENVVE